jgi:hypothetical protein
LLRCAIYRDLDTLKKYKSLYLQLILIAV